MFFRTAPALSSLVAKTAHAAFPDTPCPGLIGCGGRSANIVITNLPALGSLMVMIAAALSVVFIVLAGLRMVTALGDEGEVGAQKKAVLHVMIGLLIVILSQSIVGFAGTQKYGQGDNPLNLFLNGSAHAVSIMLTIFNAAMIIAVIIGGARMVYAQGKSDEFNKGKTIITWCIGGAIIANLANALVQSLAYIFGV